MKIKEILLDIAQGMIDNLVTEIENRLIQRLELRLKLLAMKGVQIAIDNTLEDRFDDLAEKAGESALENLDMDRLTDDVLNSIDYSTLANNVQDELDTDDIADKVRDGLDIEDHIQEFFDSKRVSITID